MLKCHKNKLWIENITNLFCNFNFIPLESMGLAEQMNALTRLIIIIFIILLLLNFKYSVLFLLLSLLFIIILYYIQRNTMETFKTEYYTPEESKKHIKNNPKMDCWSIDCKNYSDNSKRFCNDEVPIDNIYNTDAVNNPYWISVNQKLAGKANPKTNQQPVITPPSHDLNYWKASNLVSHSAINDECQTDVYRSGYQISNSCPSNKLIKPDSEQIVEKYQPNKEEFNSPYFKIPINEFTNLTSGQVNTICGYNPKQLQEAGLPTNYATGNCPQNPQMKQYNENLYTQTIQPGILTRSQINEPINSNIGISFTQQFPYTTKQKYNGDIKFTQHDPNTVVSEVIEPIFNTIYQPTEANVYDPRFTGYGTSYRSYTDDRLGQTKFYYDDINAIRMPNYIVRSNIDTQPFADKYGSVKDGEEKGNKYTSNIRTLVNDAFCQNAIDHRTDISQLLMRKRNNELWQLRNAPTSLNNGRMLGGGMGSMSLGSGFR